MSVPILICNYADAANIPTGTMFVVDKVWRAVWDDNPLPYLICRKTGEPAMAFVVIDSAATAEEAKRKFARIEKELE